MASKALDKTVLQEIQLTGNLTATQAHALLKLGFSDRDEHRMQELAAKARAGTLDAKETGEIDAYERLGALLDVLHAKARRTLQRRHSAS